MMDENEFRRGIITSSQARAILGLDGRAKRVAARHVHEGNCFDLDCEHRFAHFDADERWCRVHGWAIGNPCLTEGDAR